MNHPPLPIKPGCDHLPGGMIGGIRMEMMIGMMSAQKNTENMMIGQTSPGHLGKCVVFRGDWGKTRKDGGFKPCAPNQKCHIYTVYPILPFGVPLRTMPYKKWLMQTGLAHQLPWCFPLLIGGDSGHSGYSQLIWILNPVISIRWNPKSCIF